jgi:hypothetical protein
MKSFKEFNSINESGIQRMKSAVSGFENAEIFFHQDLDGVVTAIAMKEYLRRYNVRTVDAHIIQYGGQDFAIKNVKPGNLAVLVDFANSKGMFDIHTDHHQDQAGVTDQATSFKPARSNVSTLSAEVSPSNIFTDTDIELINTVDSADFLRKGITPEDIIQSIFKVDTTKSSQENRFMMGFVVNRLLLSYKNKYVSGKSLDGKRTYDDRNFLECLVLDSSPSLYSMYVNLQHYIKTFKSDGKKLATPEELAKNVFNYQETMKDYPNLHVDEDYQIAVQYGGGSMTKPGSYDRYTIFKNYPDINFYSIAWPMGLVQVSCNPFKEKILSNIDLGKISDDVMSNYKSVLDRTWITVGSLKKVSEKTMEQVASKASKQGKEFEERVGFRLEDLKSFYSDKTYRQTNDGNRHFVVDLDDRYQSRMRNAIDKRYTSLNDFEKRELEKFKIKAWDILKANSGGHASITNIQPLGILSYASSVAKEHLLEPTFGSSKYIDIMKKIQADFINVLKEKIDEERTTTNVGAGADSVAESFMKKFDDFDEKI